jgi:hypothetical protein
LSELSYKTFPDGGGHIVDGEGYPLGNSPFAAFSQKDLDEERQKIANIYFYMASLLESQREASMWLLKKGIKGIQYYDQGSRKQAKGTRNFVIFDESVIEKVNK